LIDWTGSLIEPFNQFAVAAEFQLGAGSWELGAWSRSREFAQRFPVILGGLLDRGRDLVWKLLALGFFTAPRPFPHIISSEIVPHNFSFVLVAQLLNNTSAARTSTSQPLNL
jgi:hypothetical protein